MAKVEIVQSLLDEIKKKFKGESHKIIDLLETLEENPHKGKSVGQVGGLLVKELKYGSFRFYFIVDGNKLKIFSKEELTDLLIKFVRMSSKNNQQKVIDEIKYILRNLDNE
ncbi:MAG: hypothetical protein UU67_C0084G0009 [Candidatus Daviesbacteria bacterium GW2011_GWB1_41_5]|uniref:Uncharacterized protein n=1 Tax=Candidatus Daviesbacteria bacterium GW2011_GWB1_41_5 TaxID=1618429 RepID=A0A0G0WGH8_9BACT|nr:MAG: hypothetical protein UU67_C0084G0009 [Candidatus Daviesbacteria bacterium GW2011_GWB1_41_5]